MQQVKKANKVRQAHLPNNCKFQKEIVKKIWIHKRNNWALCLSQEKKSVNIYHADEILLLHPFNGLASKTTRTSWYQKGKTSLNSNEARDDGFSGCSCISWTICKQSASHSTQITTPTPHHSIFTGRILYLTPNQQCQCSEGRTNNTRQNK